MSLLTQINIYNTELCPHGLYVKLITSVIHIKVQYLYQRSVKPWEIFSEHIHVLHYM